MCIKEEKLIDPLLEYAKNVSGMIRRHSPGNVAVIVLHREGRVLTSTLETTRTLEDAATIIDFTDKVKVLIRKMLNEELEFVRIKGRSDNEIVVTFEDTLEIITIQENAAKC